VSLELRHVFGAAIRWQPFAAGHNEKAPDLVFVGQALFSLVLGGGQGRGRTADLPLFRSDISPCSQHPSRGQTVLDVCPCEPLEGGVVVNVVVRRCATSQRRAPRRSPSHWVLREVLGSDRRHSTDGGWRRLAQDQELHGLAAGILRSAEV
jgi:hypothetical protein